MNSRRRCSTLSELDVVLDAADVDAAIAHLPPLADVAALDEGARA